MCGIFGVLNYSGQVCNLMDIVESLGYHSITRGQDATGVSYIKNNKIEIIKSPVPSYDFRFDQIYRDSNAYIGHVRLATTGLPALNHNNHPFPSIRRNFALAHNGILHNVEQTKKEMGLNINKIETDTYLAVQILDMYSDISINTVKRMCESVEGDFLFTILDKNGNIYIAKNNNPITIYDFYNIGIIVYASTKDILTSCISEFVELRDDIKQKKFNTLIVKDGDIIKLKFNGTIKKGTFTPKLPDYYAYMKELDKYDKIYSMSESNLCESCDEDNCDHCEEFKNINTYWWN